MASFRPRDFIQILHLLFPSTRELDAGGLVGSVNMVMSFLLLLCDLVVLPFSTGGEPCCGVSEPAGRIARLAIDPRR